MSFVWRSCNTKLHIDIIGSLENQPSFDDLNGVYTFKNNYVCLEKNYDEWEDIFSSTGTSEIRIKQGTGALDSTKFNKLKNDFPEFFSLLINFIIDSQWAICNFSDIADIFPNITFSFKPDLLTDTQHNLITCYEIGDGYVSSGDQSIYRNSSSSNYSRFTLYPGQSGYKYSSLMPCPSFVVWLADAYAYDYHTFCAPKMLIPFALDGDILPGSRIGLLCVTIGLYAPSYRSLNISYQLSQFTIPDNEATRYLAGIVETTDFPCLYLISDAAGDVYTTKYGLPLVGLADGLSAVGFGGYGATEPPTAEELRGLVNPKIHKWSDLIIPSISADVVGIPANNIITAEVTLSEATLLLSTASQYSGAVAVSYSKDGTTWAEPLAMRDFLAIPPGRIWDATGKTVRLKIYLNGTDASLTNLTVNWGRQVT